MAHRWILEPRLRGFLFASQRPFRPEVTQDIVTVGLRLRLLQVSDAASLADLMTDEGVARQTVSSRVFLSAFEAQEWVRDVRDRVSHGLEIAFAIERRSDQKLIGSISLQLRRPLLQTTGLLGYWIGRPYWGSGYGYESVDAFIAHCCGRLTLRCIDARVFEDNQASRRVLSKVGFVQRRKSTFHKMPSGEKRRILCYRYRV